MFIFSNLFIFLPLGNGNQMNIWAPEQFQLNERNFGKAQWGYSFLSKPVYLSQELEIPLVLLRIMITRIVKYYGLKTEQQEKKSTKNPQTNQTPNQKCNFQDGNRWRTKDLRQVLSYSLKGCFSFSHFPSHSFASSCVCSSSEWRY